MASGDPINCTVCNGPLCTFEMEGYRFERGGVVAHGPCVGRDDISVYVDGVRRVRVAASLSEGARD